MDVLIQMKKGISSFLALSLLAVSFMTAAPQAGAYSDVNSSDWFAPYVEALAEAGIFNKNLSHFRPADNMNRAEFVKTLVEAAGLSVADAPSAGFQDVKSSDWFAPFVNTAVEEGIINAGTNFRPGDAVTRAEAVKIALQALDIDYASYVSPKASFTDDNGHWAEDMISAAYNLSIVDGVSGSKTSFAPNLPIARAAVAKIAAYSLIVKEDPATYQRFEDGESAFSVYKDSDIVALVSALKPSTPIDTDDEEELTDDEDEVVVDNEDEDTSTDPVVVVSDGTLEVSLASSNPASVNVPYNVQGVPYLALDLTANGDDINVTELKFQRAGLGIRQNFDKVWAEIEGVRVSSKRTITTDDTVTLMLSDVRVRAGETKTVTIMASMDAISGGTVATGNTNYLQLISVDSVVTNALGVVGDFPVSGNPMGIANYEVTSAKFDNLGTATDIEVGEQDMEIGKFSINATHTTTANTKDLLVKSVRLRNVSTSRANLANSLENIYIEKSGVKVAEGTVSGDYVDFVFNNNFILEKNRTDTYTVKADVIFTETGRDKIEFKLDDREDFVAYEADTGYMASTTNVAGVSPVAADWTLDVELLVSRVVMGQEATVDELVITLGGTMRTAVGGAAQMTKIENIKAYVNGTLIDSQTPANDTASSVTLDSTFTLNTGINYIRIVADFADGITANKTLTATIDNTSFVGAEYTANRDSATSDFSGSAASATFTVKETTITASRNDGLSSESVVAGMENVTLMKFTVNATDGAAKVNTLTVTETKNAGGSLTNMKVYVDGVQTGSTRNLSANSSTSFSSLNFVVPENAQKTITLKGDVNGSVADGSTFGLSVVVASEDANNKALGDETVTSTTFTVYDKGVLTIAVDGNTPNTDLLVANASDIEVARFKFTATKDDVEITDLVLKTGNTAMDSRIQNFKLYNGTTLITSKNTLSGNASITLPSQGLVVEKDTDVVLTVKADLNAITKADQTGEAFIVTLDDVESTSVSTGNTLTMISTDYAANAMYIVNTRPTLTTQTLSTSVLTSGEQPIYKVSVAADANKDIDLAVVTFNVSGNVGGTGKTLTTTNGSVITDGTDTRLSGFKLFVNGVEENASNYTLSVSEPTENNFAVTFAMKDGNDINVSAGTSKNLELKAYVTGATSNDYVSVNIKEDSAGLYSQATITVTGTTLANTEDPASANITVNGVTIAVDIPAQDVGGTAADNDAIAATIAAAIDAHANFTATSSANVVTVTVPNETADITTTALVTAIDAARVLANDTGLAFAVTEEVVKRTITVSGTALDGTENPASANIIVNGITIPVDILITDDNNDKIAITIAAAIDGHADFSASAAANVVTVTSDSATHKELVFNLSDVIAKIDAADGSDNDTAFAFDQPYNLVWSDKSETPHSRSVVNWFNGYKVPGLTTTTTTLQN
jgi:hypothetical protein